MHIPEYSQIVSPLYLVTRKKNDFHWGPEQQQAFAQIKQEIAHAVALGPVRTGPDVKNVLYSAAGNNGLSWSLWQKVKKANWQPRGKPIWAADEWKDITTRVEKLHVKVHHVDAHVPKSWANKEHRNNELVDQAAKIEVSKIDLDWQHKGELFLARWAHDASGHQGRDATYKWAQDRGVDLTMDSISQVIHDCETCAAIKQAKRVKPLWYGGRWSKYKYGEAWQIDYITLPQTRQGKRYVLTMVEATTGWLETHPVPHATARNTILGLEKQILWRHGTPERIESDNGTHFKNSLINTWAREHGIEWVYHIPYHAPAAGKVERCNGLLKTTLKALGGGTFKNWENNLAKATWLVNTRGSTNRAGPAQSEPLRTRDGDKVPVVHMRAEHMQSRLGLQGKCEVRKVMSNPCERLTWFLKVAQAPTSNTGGMVELKGEQVKGSEGEVSLHTHTKMLLTFGDLQERAATLASLLLSTMAAARLEETALSISSFLLSLSLSAIPLALDGEGIRVGGTHLGHNMSHQHSMG
ncbi:hypothetical protein DUI87_22797 [Hirundo rustica rustica]|uniref:Integrase catalytic domain-containing protein n=1 Tax=Hirundo rustica rustica TaxID=333673 RepID=A0A3M0JHP3_HIRRU|nr:hypothetical protein DUI87_22797 [Hirundo rustica rustica]